MCGENIEKAWIFKCLERLDGRPIVLFLWSLFPWCWPEVLTGWVARFYAEFYRRFVEVARGVSDPRTVHLYDQQLAGSDAARGV